ncbi:MAG: hypothetical protein COB36_14080 [Alphaproteobacteria bacterium]|nr:MAG: hypothetical protein COB36_14080 [Alphaproteobacteria bacterium]
MMRTIKLAIKYPRSFFVSFLAKFFKSTRSVDASAKEELRKKNGAVGWAMGDKTVCGFVLKCGEDLSAEHFYFSRSLKPLRQAIPKLQADGIVFKGRVVEHGCGCAKYLHYFKDRFQMDAVGYDIYEPAVIVANTFDDVAVFHKDTMAMELEHFDLIFLSSYLPHLMHFDTFEEYISRLVKSGKQIIAMERYEPDLETILKRHGFVYRDYGFYIKP